MDELLENDFKEQVRKEFGDPVNMFLRIPAPRITRHADKKQFYDERIHPFRTQYLEEPLKSGSFPDKEELRIKIQEILSQVKALNGSEDYLFYMDEFMSWIHLLLNKYLPLASNYTSFEYFDTIRYIVRREFDLEHIKFSQALTIENQKTRMLQDHEDHYLFLLTKNGIPVSVNYNRLSYFIEKRLHDVKHKLRKVSLLDLYLQQILRGIDYLKEELDYPSCYPARKVQIQSVLNDLKIFSKYMEQMVSREKVEVSFLKEYSSDLSDRTFEWIGEEQKLEELHSFLVEKEIFDNDLPFERFRKAFAGEPLSKFGIDKIAWRDRGSTKSRLYTLRTMICFLLDKGYINPYHYHPNDFIPVLRGCFVNYNYEPITEVKDRLHTPESTSFINDLSTFL